MKARSLLLFSISWLLMMNYICSRSTEEMWMKIKKIKMQKKYVFLKFKLTGDKCCSVIKSFFNSLSVGGNIESVWADAVHIRVISPSGLSSASLGSSWSPTKHWSGTQRSKTWWHGCLRATSGRENGEAAWNEHHFQHKHSNHVWPAGIMRREQ